MREELAQELGLTENEARIYLLLLAKGPATPAELAKRLGLHRGYVYDTLARMQGKEAVSSILKDGKHHFRAIQPEALVELLKLRVQHLQHVVPQLARLAERRFGEPSVELLGGKRPYRSLLRDIIASVRKGDEVCLFGIDEQELAEEVEPLYLNQYFNVIRERRVHERIIIRKGGKQLRRAHLQYKAIDNKSLGPAAHIIYGTKVALFVPGASSIIVIDSPQIAESLKEQFNLIWRIAR